MAGNKKEIDAARRQRNALQIEIRREEQKIKDMKLRMQNVITKLIYTHRKIWERMQ